MGEKVPPTANPASGGRKAPASGGVGNETKADMSVLVSGGGVPMGRSTLGQAVDHLNGGLPKPGKTSLG